MNKYGLRHRFHISKGDTKYTVIPKRDGGYLVLKHDSIDVLEMTAEQFREFIGEDE